MPNEPIRLPNEPAPKPILESRTVWANLAIMAAVVVAKRFGYELSVDEQAVIVAVVNIALRFIATQPITLKIGGGA